jgi:hypothetical protein
MCVGGGDDSIDKNKAKTIPANIPLTIHIYQAFESHFIGEVMLSSRTIYE